MRLSSSIVDPASALGKAPKPERHAALVVVGGGPSGIAAAVTAAKAGVDTVLIDENPIGAGLIGLDVPLHFGRRADASVQNKDRMVERIAENSPALLEAMELGVEVLLGTYVFGAFVNGETVHSLPVSMLGVANETRSWMIGFDRLIVAAGARDLAIAFEGWEKPGVMGAQAWASLAKGYNAFNGRRLLILGSGATGLGVAEDALDLGCEVAGIVEVAPSALGIEDRLKTLRARGVPVYVGHAIKAAVGRAEVESAVLIGVDETGGILPGTEKAIACDTIVYAMGAVPNIELLNVLGCRLEFLGHRGGYVPVLGAAGTTSLSAIHAVGRCTGLDDTDDAARMIAEGTAAGAAVARSLGKAAPETLATTAPASTFDSYSHWRRWSDAEIAASGWDVHVCQCEEVTRAEVADLRPPRYLGAGGNGASGHNLRKLAREIPVNQDQVKRLTRAGMGSCQGRRCREQMHLLLARVTETPPEKIPLATYRAPVRPLPLKVLAAFEESEEMRRNWVAWFNIPSQWTPHWEIDHAALESVTLTPGVSDK